MDQARCWMVSNRSPKCCDESWEEKAFAEDTSGLLGGCVWPPRSYSCNFCRREFRSAQALGGHMNVHRRDRARLKLLSTTKSNLTDNNYDHRQDVANINIDENPSLVSHTKKSDFVSSFLVNHEKTLSFFCLSNDGENKDLIPFKISHNNEKASSFIGLNTGSTSVVDDKDMPNRNKRRKLDTSSSSLLITKLPDKVEDQMPKVDDDAPKKDDLDLELRLGDRPKG